MTEERFNTSTCARLRPVPAFLEKVVWSARPELTIYDTGKLPICAIRHYRTETRGSVQLAATASETEDWDALLVNRGGLGRFEMRFCGSLHKSLIHRTQCCFVPAGADSEMEFPPEAGSFAIYFPPGSLAAMVDLDCATEIAPIIGRRRERVAHLLGLIEGELVHPTFASEMMIDGLLRAIAGLLVEDRTGKPAESERVHLAPTKLKRVVEFIEAHLEAHIGLEDLARLADLSPYHFLRVFKLATGETPYQFLRGRRIERARALLVGHDMPLAELALECGFANQAHFTAAFTRELGVSPGRFRRQHQG